MNIMNKSVNLHLIIIILSLIGSALVVVSFLNFGIGLEPDSASYIATARNLLIGKGFISFDGQALTLFPPFYSILLALLSFLTNSDPVFSAALLNVLLFALIIYKSGIFLSKHADSRPIIIIGVLFILLAEPVFSNTLWALSDLLFIYLFLLYAGFLLSYIEKNNFRSFLMLIIISVLATLTRYIGITFIITTVIVILIYSNNDIRKKITSIIFYSILSFIPIGIWLIRDYLISGTIAGDRGQSRFSIFVNINRTMHVILDWCLPGYLGEHKILFILIVLPVIVVGILKFKKMTYKNLFLKFKSLESVILIVFLIVYFFFIILAETFRAESAIDSRLLSPMYIPIVFLLIVFLQTFYDSISLIKNYKLLNIMASVFFIIWISNMSLSTVSIVKNHFYQGAEYSGNLWKNYYAKDLIGMISKNGLKDSTIYSNDPYPIYFYLNRPVKLSPMKTYEHSDEIYSNLSNLKDKWPSEGKAYLIWSKEKDDIKGWLFNPTELTSISDMKLIDSTNLWTLYSVEIKGK
jgi:hypothetical protein